MISPEKLSNFLSQLTFSKPVSGFIDFCDGLHVAELIHMYAPLLVPTSELGRFKVDSGLVNRGWRRVNWEYLNRVPFKQLCVSLSEEILNDILDDKVSAIEQVLMVLMKQLDLYTRIQRNTHIYTKSYMYDNFELLSSIKTFRGSPLKYISKTSPLNKQFIRLSNVDYHTKKADVQRFLYPIIAHPSDIHIPIHLASGKMTYTIYVEFDDKLLPLKSVELHSGHSLLSRRVEVKMVPIDELYFTFFGRPAKIIDSPVEYLSEEMKERMIKLCRTVKNSFNGKTPERPFEHVVSFVSLLPWYDRRFSSIQAERAFDLLRVAVLTLLAYLTNDTQRQKFPEYLLPRMVDAGMTLPFLDHQKEVLRMIVMNYHQQILYHAQHGYVRQYNYYHYPQHFQQSENHQMNTLHDHVHYGSNYQYQPISSGVHNNCNTCIHPQNSMNRKLIPNSSSCDLDFQLQNVPCNQVKVLPQPSNPSHQLNALHQHPKLEHQQDQQKIFIPTPLPSFPPSSTTSTRTPSPSSNIISTALETTIPVPPSSVSTQPSVHSNIADSIVCSNENGTKEGPSLMKSYETMLGRHLCDLL